MMPKQVSDNFLELTTQIVAAHLSHNQLDAEVLPSLIQSVYRALCATESEAEIKPALAPTPAVPVKKSVFPDFIICLEDGKKLTMLKRHLKVSYGLTLEAYRTKWGLPPNYPIVAPNYASRRSAMAKEVGLGRKPMEPRPSRSDRACRSNSAASLGCPRPEK